jgi:hypothetical protein
VWLNLLTMAFKTGADVYANNQRTKKAISDAKLQTALRMASGEIEYQGTILENQKSDWKDEFILILLSVPIVMLGFAVWSDNPAHMEKMKLFFQYFSDLPFWYQTIFVGVIASVYGLKATDLIKKKII